MEVAANPRYQEAEAPSDRKRIGFLKVPPELLIKILWYCPDLDTLQSLIDVLWPAREIFVEYSHQLVTKILLKNLQDPEMPTYFPYIHNDVCFLTRQPVEEADKRGQIAPFKYLQYGRELCRLEKTVANIARMHDVPDDCKDILEMYFAKARFLPVVRRQVILTSQRYFYCASPSDLYSAGCMIAWPRKDFGLPLPPLAFEDDDLRELQSIHMRSLDVAEDRRFLEGHLETSVRAMYNSMLSVKLHNFLRPEKLEVFDEYANVEKDAFATISPYLVEGVLFYKEPEDMPNGGSDQIVEYSNLRTKYWRHWKHMKLYHS